MCHMSLFSFLFSLDKVVKLVRGGSVINGATQTSFVNIATNIYTAKNL